METSKQLDGMWSHIADLEKAIENWAEKEILLAMLAKIKALNEEKNTRLWHQIASWAFPQLDAKIAISVISLGKIMDGEVVDKWRSRTWLTFSTNEVVQVRALREEERQDSKLYNAVAPYEWNKYTIWQIRKFNDLERWDVYTVSLYDSDNKLKWIVNLDMLQKVN